MGSGHETNDVSWLENGNDVENEKRDSKYKFFTSLFPFKTKYAGHKWKISFSLHKNKDMQMHLRLMTLA